MELEIVHARSNKALASLSGIPADGTVEDVKEAIGRRCRRYKDVNRQELRQEPNGKALKDEATLAELGLDSGAMLYFKDRGFQISWTGVFLCEYAGPLLVYLYVHTRPWIFYGDVSPSVGYKPVVRIAAACWATHFVKRLLETVFVHRFSHATMPIGNLFKNCSYYWGFAAYVAYHVNHPLYTAPGRYQTYAGLAAFLLCEMGNFSIHRAFSQLRPAGTKVRKIPHPTSDLFTFLFNYVSCPNYTYEVGAWLAFTVMTQCLPAGLFCFAGFYQMTVWALGKHRNYKKEFKGYPPRRKAIVPFLI